MNQIKRKRKIIIKQSESGIFKINKNYLRIHPERKHVVFYQTSIPESLIKRDSIRSRKPLKS
jgi:hypothetical protein